MKRRDFLALIASTPIAALAPLPKVLEQPRLMMRVFDGDKWTRRVRIDVGVPIEGHAGERVSFGDVVYLSDGSDGLTAGRWYRGRSAEPHAISGKVSQVQAR